MRTSRWSLHLPGKLADTELYFEDDEQFVQLQAADLLAYEWRRFQSQQIAEPAKAPRTSYGRLRNCRRDRSMLNFYDEAAILEAADRARANGQSLIRAMWDQEATTS